MSIDFAALPLSAASLEVLAELGFREPTPVQVASLPALLAGRDALVRAETGSGKTLAFALTLLERIGLEQRRLEALVLCPTRELSTQVTRELRRLGRKRAGLTVATLAGGAPISAQRRALAHGVHVAVGTPGRLLDLLRRGSLDVQGVSLLVLDEADRMLTLGFAEQVSAIIALLPAQRQTALFSATFPAPVAALSAACQRDPLRIELGPSAHSPASLRSWVCRLAADDKLAALTRALAHFAPESALVFANQKRSVDEIADHLARAGLRVGALHGDLAQRDRDQALAQFRNGSLRVLVASDLAARGIDIEKLDLVVNFELPVQRDVYVHRVGRTGRAGKPGQALSLVSPAEKARLADIEVQSGALEPIELLDEPPTAAGVEPAARMQTLHILGGRKHKLRAGDILGALTGADDAIRGDQVGKIEIHDQMTYVAVAEAVCEIAYRKLARGHIKGRRFRVQRL